MHRRIFIRFIFGRHFGVLTAFFWRDWDWNSFGMPSRDETRMDG